MYDPQGTLRWVPDEQRDNAIQAGGTPVNTDGTFTVTPFPGESFSDTMARAARVGKNVSPELIHQQTMTGLKEAPLVLGAAATAGVAGPATLAAVGAGGAALPGAASAAWGNPIVQQGLRMLGQGAIKGIGMGGAYAIMKKLGLFKPAPGAGE